jgi:hypothetical protein
MFATVPCVSRTARAGSRWMEILMKGGIDHTQHRRGSAIVRGPRVIRDEAGGDMMTVVERRADGVTGARGPSCLIFSTDQGFTRLWSYPDNWMDLTDAELRRLSELRRAQSA